MNDESMMELDGGDFEPVPQVAGIESIETESQSHKGSKGAGSGEPQTIPTKAIWNRRKLIDWQSIEKGAIAGVPFPTLAKLYDTTPGSIRVKAHNEQWPTPERVRIMAEQRIREAQSELHKVRMIRANGGPVTEEQLRQGTLSPDASSGVTRGGLREDGEEQGSGEEWREEGAEEWGGSLTASSMATRNQNLTAIISENLTEMAESGTLQAARRALRSIKRAPESLPIRGASDLAILAKLLRSMAGLDSPQVAVNLGLFTSQQPDAASLGVVLEAEDVGE